MPSEIAPTEVDPSESRRQRGLAIAALCRITPKEGYWLVPSQSGTGTYQVRLDPKGPDGSACTCPDYEERGLPCKHVFAVRYVVERETRPDGSVRITESLAISTSTTAERPTYRQNWPAYNAAQTKEKSHFQALLAELCQGIEEPPPNKRGRPRMLLRDMVFAVAFKTYSTFSGRRFQTDLEEAGSRGYLTKTPHYNTVFLYLEEVGLTPVLHRLVTESALPLRKIETEFAVDSTGLMSSRFVRWFDQKYGRMTKEHEWVKVHLMCGVKTNVVTAVEILDKDAADSPQFPVMVDRTARSFTVDEVSADKAYSSRENMEAVAKAGGTAYIAFKKNATGGVGGIFEKMFHLYCLNRDEYLTHYHKRSNVESTVSMIKAKFGDSVRSKTDVAMRNEALAKVLCHNICCLIQSTYELGIKATFWGQIEDSQASVDHPREAEIGAEWAWV